jgi:hypothetical protein
VEPTAIVRRIGVIAAAAALVVLAAGVPASAAGASGHYADWSGGGAGGAFIGRATSDAAGFPAATVTSDATTVRIPAGASSFLGPATPVGAVYGSSRDRPYLNVSAAQGAQASTTTLDFATPTPAAGWAFVLGDVDADVVAISAIGADGSPVAVADLGFAGTFNYCAVSPKPSGCTGPGPFTDEPVWHPGSGRLVGNGPDTFGASGWFQPTVPIRSLTFTFSVQTGVPIFQIWLATLSVPVETTIGGIRPSQPVPAPGAIVDLLAADGTTPVLDAAGHPVEAIADDTGAVVFPAVAGGDYVLKIKPPPGVRAVGRTTIPITVDVHAGPLRLPKGTFTLVVPAQLALTGTSALPAAGIGLVCVALGFLLRRFGRQDSSGAE